MKKLRSNSGASMIMALLLMLVGVVTSAVIISAAVSAVHATKEDRTQQQSYLTVSSAAELIRDEMEAGKCDYKKTVTEVTYEYWWGERKKEDPKTDETFGDGSDYLFTSVIKSAIVYLTTYPTATFNETYTVSADGYGDVKAEVFLKKATDSEDQYSLTIWFTGGEEPDQCRMELTMDGVMTSVEKKAEPTTSWGTTTTTTITTTTIKWQDPKLQRKETTE